MSNSRTLDGMVRWLLIVQLLGCHEYQHARIPPGTHPEIDACFASCRSRIHVPPGEAAGQILACASQCPGALVGPWACGSAESCVQTEEVDVGATVIATIFALIPVAALGLVYVYASQNGHD